MSSAVSFGDGVCRWLVIAALNSDAVPQVTGDADGRCGWARRSAALGEYHDREWGVPSHDRRHLFEMLVLEGAQAGLSWATILAKRESYALAFDGFDPAAIACYDEPKIESLLADAGIVRNRQKVRGTVTNARALLALEARSGSFAEYLWSWVDGVPQVNHPESSDEVPSRSDCSDAASRDLRRQGFTFVGPTTVYALFQAAGLIDDHVQSCPAKLARVHDLTLR